MSTLAERAREWAAGDPDPTTANQLLELAESGDESGLEAAMGGTLEFGTAGIRGEVGAGSNRMNRAVVIKTTRGLVDFLLAEHPRRPAAPVVVGFDARPSSRQFAEDAVGVIAAAGLDVVYFPEVTPTPIVAYAAKYIGACAAVVITASHNPPADNGYKVYGSNAAQIIPPVDSAIATFIAATGPATAIPRAPNAFTGSHPHITTAAMDILDRYWEEIDAYRVDPPGTTLSIVYTPLHGVGGASVVELFSRTLHRDFHVVPSQFQPDGTFPTVSFPNPEEPGALDLALATADEVGAELVMANDPDADRLAAAIPFDNSWRLFTGNELGVMLGAYLLANASPDTVKQAILANSVVSSPMLAQIADTYRARHLVTLTGFKWISNAALSMESESDSQFLFGYEEALGYSVGRTVRDKDGISAAVLLADIAGHQAENGVDLLDFLHSLWRRYGLWVSTQKSLTRTGPTGQSEIVRAIDRLASDPPDSVADHPVTGMIDYRVGAEDRPFWLGAQTLIQLDLEGGRLLARPSGTEPKLKIYVDLSNAVSPDTGRLQLEASRLECLARAESIAQALSGYFDDVIGVDTK